MATSFGHTQSCDEKRWRSHDQRPRAEHLTRGQAAADVALQHIHACPWKIGSVVLRSRESP